MIEEFLTILENQKQKNLQELKIIFDVFLKTCFQQNETVQNISVATSEYVDFFININNLDISFYNYLYETIKPNESKLKIYYLSDEITWKKHKGKKISELIKMNGHYILWAILNLEFFIIENTFFLTDYIRKYPEYNQAFELNLLKQYVLEQYDGSDEYTKDNNDQSWEDSRFYDGFEGDIDTWNHYNQ